MSDLINNVVTPLVLGRPVLPQPKVISPQLGNLSSSRKGGPTTDAEARELRETVGHLANAPAPSNMHRMEVALLHRTLPKGNGSREALLKLAGTRAFWTRLDAGQRTVLAKQLGKAKSPAAAKDLAAKYESILNSVLFECARPQGKRNALTQPERAATLVKAMSYPSHAVGGEVAKVRNQAMEYAKNGSGYNTPKGQKILYDNLLRVHDEVLERAFEDRNALKLFTGRSQWIGERFASYPSGKNSWASAAHKYHQKRWEEEKCGLFNGNRTMCVK